MENYSRTLLEQEGPSSSSSSYSSSSGDKLPCWSSTGGALGGGEELTGIRMGKKETNCDFHLNGGKDEEGEGKREVGLGRQVETDQGAIVSLNINTGKYAAGKKLVAVWKCNKQIVPHRRNAYEYGNVGDVISFRIVNAGTRDAGTWTAELYDLNTLESRSRLPISISCGISVNPRGSGCQKGWKGPWKRIEQEGGFEGRERSGICEIGLGNGESPLDNTYGFSEKVLGGERSEARVEQAGSNSLRGRKINEDEDKIKRRSGLGRIGVTAGKDWEKAIEKRNVTGGLDRKVTTALTSLSDKVEGRGGESARFGLSTVKIIQESKVGRGGQERSVIRESGAGTVGPGKRAEAGVKRNLRDEKNVKLNTVKEEFGKSVISQGEGKAIRRGVNNPEVKAEARAGKSLEETVTRGGERRKVSASSRSGPQDRQLIISGSIGKVGGIRRGGGGLDEGKSKVGLTSSGQESGGGLVRNINGGSSTNSPPRGTQRYSAKDPPRIWSNKAKGEPGRVSNNANPKIRSLRGANGESKTLSNSTSNGGAKPITTNGEADKLLISETVVELKDKACKEGKVNPVPTSTETTPKQSDTRKTLKKSKGGESNLERGPRPPQPIHLPRVLTKSKGEAIKCPRVSLDVTKGGGVIKGTAVVKGGLTNSEEKIYFREVKVLAVAEREGGGGASYKSVSQVKEEGEGRGINGFTDRGTDESELGRNMEDRAGGSQGSSCRGANRVSQLVNKFRIANGEVSSSEQVGRKANFSAPLRKKDNVSARIASVEIKTRRAEEERVVSSGSCVSRGKDGRTRSEGGAGGSIASRRSSLRKQLHGVDSGDSGEVGDGFVEDFGLPLARGLKAEGGAAPHDMLNPRPAGHLLEEMSLGKVGGEGVAGGGEKRLSEKADERVNACKIEEGSVEEHYEEVFIESGEAEVGLPGGYIKLASSNVEQGGEEKSKSLGFYGGQKGEEVKSKEGEEGGGRRIKEIFIPTPPSPTLTQSTLGREQVEESSSIVPKTWPQTDRTDIVGKLGERIELDVRPWISPSAPNVQWKLPNKKIEEGESLLVLPNLSFAHSGKYEADFSQPQGSKAKKVFSVNVEGPPDVLIGLTTRKLMDDKIEVSWNGCSFDGGSNVQNYIVQHDGEKFETSELSLALPTNNNLSDGKPEVFKVAAVNKHGRGQWSTVEYCDCVQIQEGGFEDFNKLEELGKGRFGHVFRVEKSGKCFAGKFIKCIRAVDREKARQEVKILSLLRGHEKLVQIIGAFQLNREVIILTELLSGGELFERIVADDFNLTESKCKEFVQEILQGIEFVHRKSIVHLDIKPENILITPSGLKIIDFGLSQIYDPGNKQCVLFGTPEFVSPEIINYEPIGFYCDIWSIGVVTYVLVSGLSPFMGDSDSETFSNVTRGEFDFDDDAFDEVSQECLGFIRGCLSLPHTNRPSSNQCLDHPWMQQTISDAKIRKDKLKSFVLRRKWQKTGNAIRAIGRLRSYGSTSSGPEES